MYMYVYVLHREKKNLVMSVADVSGNLSVNLY